MAVAVRGGARAEFPGMTFITERASMPLRLGSRDSATVRSRAASLQRILVAVVTCVVGVVLACVIAAAVFHDSSRAQARICRTGPCFRSTWSPCLLATPCRARTRILSAGSSPAWQQTTILATNDDFVCATIMGLDEKVVDHAATKVEQRIPTAADLKQLTTGLGETMPPARRLDLTFDRAIAFVQPLYADDGRTIATLFARFSTERAIAEYMRGIVEGALAGLLVLVTIALLLYELVARVTAPLTQLTEAIHSLGAGNLSVART
jgi:hypothetical protein